MMQVNKYAGTLPMASFNEKTCYYTQKTLGKKRIMQLFLQYVIEDI